jgi:hypothetical protein
VDKILATSMEQVNCDKTALCYLTSSTYLLSFIFHKTVGSIYIFLHPIRMTEKC